ncbi:MAG TPA: hypothetical protein VJC18_00700, partial [bacterium]|nr:hypothetical protein [bacterium]
LPLVAGQTGFEVEPALLWLFMKLSFPKGKPTEPLEDRYRKPNPPEGTPDLKDLMKQPEYTVTYIINNRLTLRATWNHSTITAVSAEFDHTEIPCKIFSVRERIFIALGGPLTGVIFSRYADSYVENATSTNHALWLQTLDEYLGTLSGDYNVHNLPYKPKIMLWSEKIPGLTKENFHPDLRVDAEGQLLNPTHPILSADEMMSLRNAMLRQLGRARLHAVDALLQEQELVPSDRRRFEIIDALYPVLVPNPESFKRFDNKGRPVPNKLSGVEFVMQYPQLRAGLAKVLWLVARGFVTIEQLDATRILSMAQTLLNRDPQSEIATRFVGFISDRCDQLISASGYHFETTASAQVTSVPGLGGVFGTTVKHGDDVK